MCHLRPSSTATTTRWLSMGFSLRPRRRMNDLSDFCHHIESESDFTTSPIYDVLPQFPCEKSHNPHHLSEMSDSTICDVECTYFEGVSEPPHRERECEIVYRSCEATFNTYDLTSTSIVSSHLVLGLLHDDMPILDESISPMETMMAMLEEDAPPHGSIKMKMIMTCYSTPHLQHMSDAPKVT